MIEPTSNSVIPKSAILQAVQDYTLAQFNTKHDVRLVYHNYHHTCQVVDTLVLIGQKEGFTANELEIPLLAAWFCNLPLLESKRETKQAPHTALLSLLHSFQYPQNKQDSVLACWAVLQKQQPPNNQLEYLVQDAQQAVDLQMLASDKIAFWRLEEELLNNRKFSNLEWAQYQMQQLMAYKFYLPFSKNQFEPLVAQQLLHLKRKVEKIGQEKYNSDVTWNDTNKKFHALETKIPNRATQTFFRTNYRNHINLSAIADNKANIMISVNAIIISVLISILSYGNIMETRPMVLMPVVIFLISGLTSLIFAVLSARPKVTSLYDKHVSIDVAKRNLVYFGNFVQLDLEQYEEAMDAMFRDGELIYGNMTRDLYYLGKVLDQKYRFLNISYTVFMIGFIATVITFLIAIFI